MAEHEGRPPDGPPDCVACTVVSGKGGTGKSTLQRSIAGEASREGLRTLLIDDDPAGNLSARHGVSQHATGLGNVLEAGGITADSPDIDRGASRLRDEITKTDWEGVDLLPAGVTALTRLAQVQVDDALLLRDILEAAGVYDEYALLLVDTGGFVGPLVNQALYACHVAYAPIGPSHDAVRKARQARERILRVQRSHAIRWAGVVLTAFDTGNRGGDIEVDIRATAYEQFGHEIRAEIPRRALVSEAYHMGERIGDRRGAAAANIARALRGFLFRDILGQPAGIPTGVLL